MSAKRSASSKRVASSFASKKPVWSMLLFIVSQVSIADAGEGKESSAAVELADGVKCPRCWKRSAGTGDARGAELCPRCSAALDAIGAQGPEGLLA